MAKTVTPDMDLFFIKDGEVNWIYFDDKGGEENQFYLYYYSFEEFKNLAELYTVPSVFFEKLMESGERLIVTESEDSYFKSQEYFYSGDYDFEGITQETIDGILNLIKEAERDPGIETFRIMNPEEQKYAYSQRKGLDSKSGCIAHLRADFGSLGTSFFSSFDVHNNTIAFKKEFQEDFNKVIGDLRHNSTYKGLLYNRDSMKKFCLNNVSAKFCDDNKSYGFRVDTEEYAYLLRCNPQKGEYNLYCYAYVKDVLDRHIEKAGNGICFTDSNYSEKFRIADGEKIRVTYPNGKHEDHYCRFYDNEHAFIGDKLYNLADFAKEMKQAENTFERTKPSLTAMIKSAEKIREPNQDETVQDKSKYYFNLDELEEIKSRFLKSEGYRCLHRVRLYPEEEYKVMSEETRNGMWGVYKPGSLSFETAFFNSIADAYKSLIETESQRDFENEHDL